MGSIGEFPVYAVLPCSDLERAKTWYREKLGLTARDQEGPESAWYECGEGTWFILTTSAYAGTAKNTAMGFTVTGIGAVMADLRSSGVEFLEYDLGEMGKTVDGLLSVGPYKVAWLEDSEGNIVEISQVESES